MQTKAERLEELRIEEEIYQEFDKYMDAGWRAFVDDVRQKNLVSNTRLFKVLSKIRGNLFVVDLYQLRKKMKAEHSYIELVKNPKGVLLKESRVESIPELMVDARPSEYRTTTIYIHIIGKHWIEFYA